MKEGGGEKRWEDGCRGVVRKRGNVGERKSERRVREVGGRNQYKYTIMKYPLFQQLP